MTEKSSRVMAARGTYSYDTVGANPGAVHFLTTIIIAFNVFFAILGATMLALGFWLTLDITFKNWVIDLGMERFWVGVYILMAAGVLVMLQSFFGICGAFQRKGRMLVVFCGSLVICFVLEIVGGTYMLANGIQHSLIEDWLHNRFYHFIDVFDQDEGARRIMNIIQQYVGCCGVEGVMDYTRWHKVVPETCFDQVTGNVWYLSGTGSVGCVRKFTSYLEGKAGWIAGLAFFLAFFQIFSFFAAFCLIKLKRDYQKSQEYLDR
ncbi:tetraspanin-2A-like [Homarus americanus]|uniref:tetraspanin-2A-like n=1 Tax=Homarus americanus TaxID=6706 RepID=UPI001C470AB8|nr:tetraspanin-2A-like [Homarus americanus]XP_042233240.1 tetraspanin-2A-like [Homarus americanus]XP_042233241.1 tetraspanin-2A-like [Homarus americanus]XP_042233242.1 tetraspanin-2A-like [Homarus americanus]